MNLKTNWILSDQFKFFLHVIQIVKKVQTRHKLASCKILISGKFHYLFDGVFSPFLIILG